MGGSQVCGLIISYHPSREIDRNITILNEQVGSILVVDNTPDLRADEVLRDLESKGICTVIRNNENLGIAAALNVGIRHAISRGFQWIIAFDQDSKIPSGYVEAILSTYKEASANYKVGVVCPQYEDARLGGVLKAHRAANGDLFSCFTSGSIMEAATFRALGLMEENLFIDFVDIEYCLRMRAVGFKVIESKQAILAHSLGRITWHRVLGVTFYTTNHSPGRRYYITRNRLVMMRRYLYKDREWVISDFKGMVVDTVKILLAEQDKLLKMKYMMRGVYDALMYRLGPRVAL